MVMHVTLLCEDLVSFVTNTYVVILMIYAYLKYMVKRRCVFRYENDGYADIETISSYLGK